jgi:hypothetical protein
MNFDMSFDAAMDIEVTKFANGGDVFGLGGNDGAEAGDDASPDDAPMNDLSGDSELIDVDPIDVIDAVEELGELLSTGGKSNSESDQPIEGVDFQLNTSGSL